MVKLYKFDKDKGAWVLADWGVLSKVNEYMAQGYIIKYG